MSLRRIKKLCVHVCHSCTSNCRGCNHLSPWHFRDPWRLDAKDLSRDLGRIRDMGTRVRELHLLGGEPGMHEKLDSCIWACKGFPAQLWLKSNGMIPFPDKVWAALRDSGFKVQITNYGLAPQRVARLKSQSQRYGVPLRIGRPGRWHLRFQTQDFGDAHRDQAFRDCDYSPYKYLQGGKLYRCSIDAYGEPYFKALGLEWVDTGIGIHRPQSFDSFTKPSPNCRICRTASERVVGNLWRRITREEVKKGINS